MRRFHDASVTPLGAKTSPFIHKGSPFHSGIILSLGGEVDVDIPSDGDATGLDTGTIIFDGGFNDEPTIENNGNGKRVGGTTTDYAKFLFSIGVPEAGQTYTMTYDPDFSGLSQGGALAMVGFGFKDKKKYHLTGLKGDGSTGLNANQAYGNNFEQLKATTEVDGGAASHGTQAGPNRLRITIAADGTTYTLSTSSDGSTWVDEFTDDLPTPLDVATDASDFGIAIYLDGEDTGSFTVDITLWKQVVLAELDFIGVTEDTSNLTTYTFQDVNIGAAHSDRITPIAVFGTALSSRTVETVKIGPPGEPGELVTATRSSQASHSRQCCIAHAATPWEGTTADIVVTFSSGAIGCLIGTYRVVPSTTTRLDQGATGAGGPPQVVSDVEVADGGAVITAIAISGNSVSGLAITNTGVDSFATDHGPVQPSDGTSSRYAMGSGLTTEDATTNDIGWSWSGNNGQVVVVSFR